MPRSQSILAAVLAVVAAAGFAVRAPVPTWSAFTAAVSNASNTVGTATFFTCAAAATAFDKNAYFIYPLAEHSGSTSAADVSGQGADGAYRGAMASDSGPGASCGRDSGGAYQLNGMNSYITTPNSYKDPRTFSLVDWFRTTTNGGEIIGWGTIQSGADTQYDRMVYVTDSGRLTFGTYRNGYQTVTSPGSYSDGKWHQVIATMSPSTGMRLYVDGALVNQDASYKAPESDSGYWRIGYDSTGGWPNTGAKYFTGEMRYASAYSTVLTAAQVNEMYAAGSVG